MNTSSTDLKDSENSTNSKDIETQEQIELLKLIDSNNSSRTYRDPIHQEITLDSADPVENLLIKLIDTKEFQRLRWLRQLGTSWYTFHGAEGSRFPHSLGAMHVARLILKQIQKQLKLDKHTYMEYKSVVLPAALLHDIGHGPFSHSGEKIIKTQHEEWSKRIILAGSPENKKYPDDKLTEVNKVLRSFRHDLPEKIVELLEKRHPVKFLSNIVSSQLDCDRFDYLIRDSYNTGTSYGHFDLNRVISSISVDEDRDCLVVCGEKGMLSVEDYLYARYSMYLQVYQHKKCLATDVLLQKVFKRAKMLAHHKKISFVEKEVFYWMVSPEKLHLDNYLRIDDTTLLHHIKHWVFENDFILKDLASRFINRQLFKSTKVSSEKDFEKIYNDQKALLKAKGLDPDYYLDVATIASNPYSFYNPDNSGDFSKAIFVKTKDGQIKEISELSHIVSSLVKGDFENKWVVSI